MYEMKSLCKDVEDLKLLEKDMEQDNVESKMVLLETLGEIPGIIPEVPHQAAYALGPWICFEEPFPEEILTEKAMAGTLTYGDIRPWVKVKGVARNFLEKIREKDRTYILALTMMTRNI
jgi:hypothetical protein